MLTTRVKDRPITYTARATAAAKGAPTAQALESHRLTEASLSLLQDDAVSIDLNFEFGEQHHDQGKSSLYRDAMEFANRHDARREIYRIGRRAAKLFRIIDRGDLSLDEYHRMKGELEMLQAKFQELLRDHKMQVLGGEVLVAQQSLRPGETAESAAPTQTQAGAEAQANQTEATSPFDSLAEDLFREEVRRMEASELQGQLLAEMMETEAKTLAQRISSQPVDDAKRLESLEEAQSLAKDVAKQVLATPDAAIIAAIGAPFDRDHIFSLLRT